MNFHSRLLKYKYAKELRTNNALKNNIQYTFISNSYQTKIYQNNIKIMTGTIYWNCLFAKQLYITF